MKRPFLALAACALAAAADAAGPRLGDLPANDGDAAQFCQFSADDAAGRTVLQINAGAARIVLDGRLIELRVEEETCTRDCVGPGSSGQRVFRLSGSGVLARLSKRVECAKDAEVCGGLPEGPAELRVSTAAGETAMAVWGEYCDM